MRISDWSSDLCSSDLEPAARPLSHGSSCIRHKPALAACIYGFRGHAASQQECVNQGVSPSHDQDRPGAPWCARSNPARESGAARCQDLARSEEHTSELQSLMRISYAVFCLKKKTNK